MYKTARHVNPLAKIFNLRGSLAEISKKRLFYLCQGSVRNKVGTKLLDFWEQSRQKNQIKKLVFPK